MAEYKMIRIRLSTWRRIRRTFPSIKGESFSDYLERLNMELKNEP